MEIVEENLLERRGEKPVVSFLGFSQLSLRLYRSVLKSSQPKIKTPQNPINFNVQGLFAVIVFLNRFCQESRAKLSNIAGARRRG